MRYAWFERERALAEAPALMRPLLNRQLERIKRWDLAASGRVDHYIAVSDLAKHRIREAYGRDSAIVHPPVEVDRFRIGTPGEHLLVVAEVVRHKRIEVALAAAKAAGRPIRIVGEGPDLERLRSLHPEAEFLGRVSDAELDRLLPEALALVVPNVEEFGIAAVEAMAAGRPVLAADAGGARETVRDGETGILVPEGDVAALADCMRSTDFSRFSPELIREHALGFGTDRFRERFAAEVERARADAQ